MVFLALLALVPTLALAYMLVVPHVQLILPAVPYMAPGYADCLKFSVIATLAWLPFYLAGWVIKQDA